MSGKPTVGLSAWLAFFVLGAVVPLLFFAGATLLEISKDAQAAKNQGQADTARALALAVDGEIRSWKSAVTALAASRALQQGRLADFDAEARLVAAQHEGWIVLTVASGQQLVNTLLPYGTPLPKTSSPETINAIFSGGKPVVSDVFYGKVTQGFLVAVGVPVWRDGKVVNGLTLNFSPQRLTRLLERQNLSPSWVSAINDRQHQVVARSRDIETRVGKPVVPWLAAAEAAADRGILTGPLIDGRLGQVAFQRLQEVPWVVSLAVPVAELPSTTPLVLFLLVGAAVGCAAVGAAIYTGRKLTAPVSRLAQAGEPLLRGETVDLGAPSGIREVRELQQALGEAAAAVQGYYQERERAAIAEEKARAAAASEQVIRERERALRESEERLQLFIENAPTAIAMFDRDMRYLAVSRRWMTDYSLSGRDLVGQFHYDVFPDLPDAWKAAHHRGLAGEVVMATEDRFDRRDGTAQWLRWEVRPWHKGDGTIGGIILFTEDITERKRAEEEIRGLAKFPDENPFPVIRTNGDGTILYANLPSLPLLEAWGAGKDRMLPQPWRDTVRQVLTAGSSREVEVVCKERVFLIHLVPIRVEGYVNLYGRDITERKRAEEALREAHDDLERRVAERTVDLSRAVQQLEKQSAQLRALAAMLTLAEERERQRVASVLHDGLQQLLVGMKLVVSPLARSADPKVREAGREVGDLINESLQCSRSLTEELSPPILRRGGLVPALEWLVRWMAEKHHLTVLVHGDATAGAESPDTTVLLFQAIRELLFNTVKHAGVETAHVEIVRRDDQVQVCVSDNGAGFDPTQLRVAGGNAGGFGLFALRERLELLGGHMEIESAPGQGCRFTLRVPVHEAMAGSRAAAAPAAPDSATSAVQASGSGLRKMRILVAEDPLIALQGLVRLLNGEPDMEVIGQAADGQTAVALTRQLLPDVVTMDIEMPGMNGIEATRIIHAECPAVQVIGLWMYESQAPAMREAGAVNFLPKAGPAEDLIAAIRACGRPSS